MLISGLKGLQYSRLVPSLRIQRERITSREHGTSRASFPAYPAIFTMTSFLPSFLSPLNKKYVGTGDESDSPTCQSKFSLRKTRQSTAE